MIIIASQRGGAAKLAAHLMNNRDNDHVELHEVSGFMADTLPDALQEIRAQAMGTRCNQYLFSAASIHQKLKKLKQVFLNKPSIVSKNAWACRISLA